MGRTFTEMTPSQKRAFIERAVDEIAAIHGAGADADLLDRLAELARRYPTSYDDQPGMGEAIASELRRRADLLRNPPRTRASALDIRCPEAAPPRKA